MLVACLLGSFRSFGRVRVLITPLRPPRIMPAGLCPRAARAARCIAPACRADSRPLPQRSARLAVHASSSGRTTSSRVEREGNSAHTTQLSSKPAISTPGQHAQPQASQQQPKKYDADYWHYQPQWLQPRSIIGAGLVFFVLSMWLDNEHPAKTAVLAAGPLVLFWGMFLWALPRQFRGFVKDHGFKIE